jgi:hypothetical protein
MVSNAVDATILGYQEKKKLEFVRNVNHHIGIDRERDISLERITEDTIRLETYINKTWGKFTTEKEVALKNLFPEPENKGLKHIWKYGFADLVVKRNDKIIAIFEPGGIQHFDKKQKKNDARKFKLCELNNVRCLHLMNGFQNQVSKRKLRQMIGKNLW